MNTNHFESLALDSNGKSPLLVKEEFMVKYFEKAFGSTRLTQVHVSFFFTEKDKVIYNEKTFIHEVTYTGTLIAANVGPKKIIELLKKANSYESEGLHLISESSSWLISELTVRSKTGELREDLEEGEKPPIQESMNSYSMHNVEGWNPFTVFGRAIIAKTLENVIKEQSSATDSFCNQFDDCLRSKTSSAKFSLVQELTTDGDRQILFDFWSTSDESFPHLSVSAIIEGDLNKALAFLEDGSSRFIKNLELGKPVIKNYGTNNQRRTW